MKILLVDDSKMMRSILKKALAAIPDAEFSEAGDGVEALGVLSGQSFNLAVVDWNMPNMDGLTLVRRIRETDRKTLLVMCTTEAEKSKVVDAIKSGVNNYVIKPFTTADLVEKVKQTLERAAA